MSLTEIVAALQALQALALHPGFIPAAVVVVVFVFILRGGSLNAEVRFTATVSQSPDQSGV
jgi:hypothetical protein